MDPNHVKRLTAINDFELFGGVPDEVGAAGAATGQCAAPGRRRW
jgi:hypothetical protein